MKLMTRRFFLFFVFLCSSASNVCAAKEKKEEDLFTINYNNVSILEYVRFVSKISNTNFIFNEEDLNFNVTVVSEEPTSEKNVMATLIQVLRMHNLTLLEQDNNLVIHKSEEVRQLATVFSDKDTLNNAPPIVTKVFRIYNAQVAPIVAILRPMISNEALLEVNVETRQIIVTDITANVVKIGHLIENLDSPASPMEIETYKTKFNPPANLINLTQQIMMPLAQGNPYILVPQTTTDTIFIVSTPQLVEKTMAILSNLDVSGKSKKMKPLKPENVFIYKPHYQSSRVIEQSLENLADTLQEQGYSETGLLETIDNMKWMKETDSFVFTGENSALTKLREILATIDQPGRKEASLAKNSFFMYKPQHRTLDEMEKGIADVAKKLEKSSLYKDKNLIETLQSAKAVFSSHAILFTGNPSTFNQVKELLASIDISTGKTRQEETFYIYKIKSGSGKQILQSLDEMSSVLNKSNVDEDDLIKAIHKAKYIKDTNSLVFTGTPDALQRLQEILPTFDVTTYQAIPVSNNFLVYKPKHIAGERLEEHLQAVTKNLESAKLVNPAFMRTLMSMRWVPSTNSLIFTGDADSLKRVETVLSTYDAAVSEAPGEKIGYTIYHLKFATKDMVDNYLDRVSKNLANGKGLREKYLIEAINSKQWIPESESFMFTGQQQALAKIEEMLKEIDLSVEQERLPGSKQSFFIYHLKYTSKDLVEDYLQRIAKNLSKEKNQQPLINAINSMKWIPDSRAFMFSGQQNALNRVKQLLSEVDAPAGPGGKMTYYIYRLKSTSRNKVENYLNQVATNLEKSDHVHEMDLIEAIHSMRWIADENSLMFSGTESSITQIKNLLENIATTGSKTTFFIYEVKYVSRDKFEEYLDQLAENLEKSGREGVHEEELINAIHSMKWMPETHSVMFSGTQDGLQQLKDLLERFDVSSEALKPTAQPTYFLYKLQNVSGDIIEDDLHSFSKKLRSSHEVERKHEDLIDLIDNVKWVKETNSLLLTGTPNAIEEAKKLIANYDIQRTTKPIETSNFFMYKPQHLSASQIEKSLRDVASNLEKASLTDPNLLHAIDSMRYVSSTNSIIFTGDQTTITKIQDLLKTIDISSGKVMPIQKIGKTTFLLYKLQKASGPQIMKSINEVAKDLSGLAKSTPNDKDFLDALDSMKYIKETNSLLFTGTQDALERVKSLVEKFDISALAEKSAFPEGPSTFYIYKPKYLTGPALEEILKNFAEHLQRNNLQNKSLYQTIETMRWQENTNSMIFTGPQTTLDEVKELLSTFDVPGKESQTNMEPSIQEVDNTSFLVYKLQFHQGTEIQAALRDIARDLIKSNAPVNSNLLTSINSIQFIKVTNSLLCSGDQETLTRLRELIKNLDIPLKQVFIEMLIIETDLTNLINFGLDWAGKFQYRKRVAGSIDNIAPFDDSTGLPTLFQNFDAINATRTPVASDIPSGSGFDLGVIGDVVKHNGNTFFSMASLVQALQQDQETTIIMTPKLITQDSKTSRIFIGKNQPFVGSFVSNQTANTLSTTNLEYRDIGIDVTLTPVLGNSDIVTLDIKLQRTSTPTDVTATTITVGSATSVSGITTQKTTMNTTVHVPNKNFLILSGMVDEERVRQKAGIPCLGGLPLIGLAFSQNSRTDTVGNIVIFMRPHIITSYADMVHLTETQEDFFRDAAGTPGLELDFDEGMEMIKSYDDE